MSLPRRIGPWIECKDALLPYSKDINLKPLRAKPGKYRTQVGYPDGRVLVTKTSMDDLIDVLTEGIPITITLTASEPTEQES